MTISFSYIYRETIKFKRLIKSHSASSQLSRLCDWGFSLPNLSKDAPAGAVKDGRLCPKAHQQVQDSRLRLRWIVGIS